MAKSWNELYNISEHLHHSDTTQIKAKSTYEVPLNSGVAKGGPGRA